MRRRCGVEKIDENTSSGSRNLLLVLDIVVQFVLIISRFVDNSGGQHAGRVGLSVWIPL